MASQFQFGRKAGCKTAVGFVFIAGAWLALAGAETNSIFAQRAEAKFQEAQARFQSGTNGPDAAWQLGRAAFDLADLATNDTERADVARVGIAACRQLLLHNPKSAAGHYYLAMNDGQLAKALAPSLAAYRLVKEIEREFKTAAELDSHFDYAGPERCLGLLYRDAPGWPFSIGNRRKARDWLEQAAKLAPEDPENRLNLVESHLRWKERDAAKQDLQTLDALWPKARTNFTGMAWERSWIEWTARKKAAEQSLAP